MLVLYTQFPEPRRVPGTTQELSRYLLNQDPFPGVTNCQYEDSYALYSALEMNY